MTAIPAALFLVAGADVHAVTGTEVPLSAEPTVDAVDDSAPVERATRAVHREVLQPLPASIAPETGLQVKTIFAARAISATFPEILQIGGVRGDSLRWHPDGLAIDVMIPDYGSAEGRATGDRVVAFVLENAERFDLHHVLWRQTSYARDRAPRPMADRGSDTQNHYDHVHIATNGGGYPTGNEIYLR